MNSLNIAGYLGNDAEVRMTPSGTAITTFSLPVEQGWGDNKKTTWVRCTLFGKKGSNEAHGLTDYLTKGRFVAVTGELVLEEWESKGEKHALVSCIVRDTKLGPQPESNRPAPRKSPQDTAGNDQHHNPPEDFEDDIPF
jgi:single-strand DNA-binding protein